MTCLIAGNTVLLIVYACMHKKKHQALRTETYLEDTSISLITFHSPLPSQGTALQVVQADHFSCLYVPPAPHISHRNPLQLR